MAGNNSSFAQVGPTPGILNPKKKSNILAGFSLPQPKPEPTPILGNQSNTIGNNTGLLNQPKNTNILSGVTLPSTTPTQNTGLTQGGKNITSPVPQNNYGELPKPIIQTDVQGNKYQPAKPNPSVLAQQQALNKQGAGLVEDGITGPKTREAIAKYGSSSTTSTDTDTSKPKTFSQEEYDKGIADAKTQVSSSNTVAGKIPNVESSSKPTDLETQKQEQLQQAGQMTPEERASATQLATETDKLKGFQNASSVSPYADLSLYGDRVRTPEELLAIQQQPDLVGRASSTQGLTSALGNIYGTGAVYGAGQQLAAAQTAAGRGLTAAQTGLSGAQTTANRGLAGATTALGAVAPQYGISYGTQVGQPGLLNGGINADNLGGIAAPSNIRSIQDYTSQINTTQKSIDTLKGLGSAIAPNMGTTGFNPFSSPIGNDTFQKYYTEKNPAAKAGIVSGLGEIKNQISNVIASATGLTPTGVTAVTDTYDLTDLNPQQLNDFLLYIDKYAQINMEAANKSIERIKSGGSVDANTGLLPSPQDNSTLQALTGTGASAAKGLISKVLEKTGSAVAGAIGGFASTFFK